MRYFFTLFGFLFLIGCENKDFSREILLKERKSFEVSDVRTMAFFDDVVGFGGENYQFGMVDLQTLTIKKTQVENRLVTNEVLPIFERVAYTNSDFFLLSKGEVFKTEIGGMKLVQQSKKNSFRDIAFQNTKQGVILQDEVQFFSFLTTDNGGISWKENNLKIKKINKENLPTKKVIWPQEKGFRFLSSGIQPKLYKIENQKVIIKKMPFKKGELYFDYYDGNQAIVVNLLSDSENAIALTFNGGESWEFVSSKMKTIYAVAYFPASRGNELLISSLTGIWHSVDKGRSWKKISEEIVYDFAIANGFLVATNFETVKIFQISEKK